MDRAARLRFPLPPEPSLEVEARVELPRFRRHLDASGRKPGKVRFWCRERGRRIRRSSAARRSGWLSWATSRSAGSPRIWGSPMSRCRNWMKEEKAAKGERPGGLSGDEREELRGCGMRTRSCGWSGRSCEKRRSSSRRRTTGGRRGYSFIAAEKSNYPVAVMCRVFGVSRTGFHNWERRAPSDRALQDAWLTEKIKQIHEQSRGVYGVAADPCRAAPRARHPGRGEAGREADASRRYHRRQAQKALEDDDPDPRDHARPLTSSSATSTRRVRMCCGSLTSPTCAPARDGSTSPRSRTPTRG